MKFSYQLSIASMMILLFVSGLSIVRSEEAPDSVKMKGFHNKDIFKSMNIQKIEPSSTDDDDDLVFTTPAENCNAINVLLNGGCSTFSSPTGLFSLTYTNNNGQTSWAYVISETLWSQSIVDDDFVYAPYINTNDLYICTGTYDSSTDDLNPAYGGCDLTKLSVDSGETYYFVTSSDNYSWSVSFPLGNGAIAGIVIGVLVFLGCCCGVIFVIMNNKKRAPPQPQTTVVQIGPGQATQNPAVITTNAV